MKVEDERPGLSHQPRGSRMYYPISFTANSAIPRCPKEKVHGAYERFSSVQRRGEPPHTMGLQRGHIVRPRRRAIKITSSVQVARETRSVTGTIHYHRGFIPGSVKEKSAESRFGRARRTAYSHDRHC